MAIMHTYPGICQDTIDDNTLAEVDYKILETKEEFMDFYNSFNAE